MNGIKNMSTDKIIELMSDKTPQESLDGLTRPKNGRFYQFMQDLVDKGNKIICFEIRPMEYYQSKAEIYLKMDVGYLTPEQEVKQSSIGITRPSRPPKRTWLQ